MIGLGGQFAQANVTLNGITWGDPFAGLVNKTRTEQLPIVSSFGGTVATWADIRTSADTNADATVSIAEFEAFLIAIGFPSLTNNNLCPLTTCDGRLGVGEAVGIDSGDSYTFGAPSYILSDFPFTATPSNDDIQYIGIGMLWIVNTPTPEPSIISLLGFSLFSLVMLRKRSQL